MSNFLGISDVRTKLPSLVSKVSKNLERVVITVQGQPKAVLLSPEELESIEETAEILSIPGARESIKQSRRQIKKGQVVSFEKVVGQSVSDIIRKE